MRGLFWGCKSRDFFFLWSLFQVCFCPVKRGNRAGSSRNDSDYSRRGTQTSFPLLDSRNQESLGLAHFSIQFSSYKTSYQTEPPFCSAVSFMTTHLKMSLSEILEPATLEKRGTVLGTSPRVVRLFPRRAGSIFALCGAIINLKARKAL